MSSAGVIQSSGGSSSGVSFLQGNTGGNVPPDGSNTIFVVGSGVVSVSGNPGTSTLTISATGFSNWMSIIASQTLAVNSGYFCSGGGTLSLALPATSSIGDTIEINLDGSAGFTITQSAGQRIKIGNLSTTIGVGGSLSSSQQGDSIRLVCKVANLQWNVIDSVGNLVIV